MSAMKQRTKPNTVPLTKEQKTVAANKIKEYVSENLDAEISGLQSEIFADFISEELGRFYYNKGIADAFTHMTEKTEDLYTLTKDEEIH